MSPVSSSPVLVRKDFHSPCLPAPEKFVEEAVWPEDVVSDVDGDTDVHRLKTKPECTRTAVPGNAVVGAPVSP
jgi:hypothetical protein